MIRLEDMDEVSRAPQAGSSGNTAPGGVTFAPTINIQGNADRSEIDAALRDAEARFRKWYEDMMRRKRQVAF